MKWTKDLPAEPGFYWWRNRTTLLAAKKISTVTGIGRLMACPDRGLLFKSGVTVPLSEFRGYEFAGPIPEPEGSD